MTVCEASQCVQPGRIVACMCTCVVSSSPCRFTSCGGGELKLPALTAQSVQEREVCICVSESNVEGKKTRNNGLCKCVSVCV